MSPETIKKQAQARSIDTYMKKGFSLEEARQKYLLNSQKLLERKIFTPEERKSLLKKYRQKYHQDHKEEIKEKRKEYFREYRKKRSEYYSLACHKRRARLLQLGEFTLEEWKDLKKQVNYLCACCLRKEGTKEFPLNSQGNPKLTKDHIIPISKNGDNVIGNIQPLCWECHKKKRLSCTNFLTDFTCRSALLFGSTTEAVSQNDPPLPERTLEEHHEGCEPQP